MSRCKAALGGVTAAFEGSSVRFSTMDPLTGGVTNIATLSTLGEGNLTFDVGTELGQTESFAVSGYSRFEMTNGSVACLGGALGCSSMCRGRERARLIARGSKPFAFEVVTVDPSGSHTSVTGPSSAIQDGPNVCASPWFDVSLLTPDTRAFGMRLTETEGTCYVKEAILELRGRPVVAAG
jgi:hypothetical protein